MTIPTKIGLSWFISFRVEYFNLKSLRQTTMTDIFY